MVALSISLGHRGAHTPLTAEIVDALTESIVAACGPVARSALIADLVGELNAATRWLSSGQDNDEELFSLSHVLAAADDHRLRMSRLAQATDPGGVAG